jgi:hypothetical protein
MNPRLHPSLQMHRRRRGIDPPQPHKRYCRTQPQNTQRDRNPSPNQQQVVLPKPALGPRRPSCPHISNYIDGPTLIPAIPTPINASPLKGTPNSYPRCHPARSAKRAVEGSAFAFAVAPRAPRDAAVSISERLIPFPDTNSTLKLIRQSRFQSVSRSSVWPSRCHTNSNYLHIGSLLHPGCLPRRTPTPFHLSLRWHAQRGIRGLFSFTLCYTSKTKPCLSGVAFHVDGQFLKRPHHSPEN